MKKKSLPPRADERDRAKFAKAQSYMVRKDDLLACKNMRCRKRFEIAGIQTVAFLSGAHQDPKGRSRRPSFAILPSFPFPETAARN